MKSRTITCFNATVRLAHIVEQCLDLDNELLMVPSASTPESRQLYVMDETTRQEEISRIERQKEQLAGRLVDWWNRLDPDLQVDTASKVCPPIHFVVNCSVSPQRRNFTGFLADCVAGKTVVLFRHHIPSLEKHWTETPGGRPVGEIRGFTPDLLRGRGRDRRPAPVSG